MRLTYPGWIGLMYWSNSKRLEIILYYRKEFCLKYSSVHPVVCSRMQLQIPSGYTSLVVAITRNLTESLYFYVQSKQNKNTSIGGAFFFIMLIVNRERFMLSTTDGIYYFAYLLTRCRSECVIVLSFCRIYTNTMQPKWHSICDGVLKKWEDEMLIYVNQVVFSHSGASFGLGFSFFFFFERTTMYNNNNPRIHFFGDSRPYISALIVILSQIILFVIFNS